MTAVCSVCSLPGADPTENPKSLVCYSAANFNCCLQLQPVLRSWPLSSIPFFLYSSSSIKNTFPNTLFFWFLPIKIGILYLQLYIEILNDMHKYSHSFINPTITPRSSFTKNIRSNKQRNNLPVINKLWQIFAVVGGSIRICLDPFGYWRWQHWRAAIINHKWCIVSIDWQRSK